MDNNQPQPTIIAPQEVTVANQPTNKNSKRLIIFIIIALMISLGVSLFIWLYPFNKNMVQDQQSLELINQKLTLDLINPKDGELAVNDEILITGKTLPGATVAVFDEIDEATVVSNQDGSFETTLKLTMGINSITVTSYTDDGEEKSITLDIVYDAES